MMKIRPLETHTKILEVQSRLSKFDYLSKGSLPGTADAYVYQKLQKSQKMPCKEKYQNFYHWYVIMRQFAPSAIQKWIKDDQTLENDQLIVQLLKLIDPSENLIVENQKDLNEYVMNISTKKQGERIRKFVWRKLEESLANFSEKVVEHKFNEDQIRLKIKLSEGEFQEFRDKISRWDEVNGIESKKVRKQLKV